MTRGSPVREAQIWDTYYAETDPERRRQILSDGIRADPENDRIPLRRRLWDLRYTDPQNPKHRVDLLLWQFVNILCIYRMSGPRFFRKNGEKEIRESIQTMGFREAAAFGSAGEEELYREFRNAAHRYFTACSGDKSYHKKYCGVVTMKPEEFGEKLARDAWRLSEGVEERFHLGRELELFSRAVRDEFFAFSYDAGRLWEQCAAVYRKKCPGRSGAAS